jgi:hypothetical protein
LLDLLLFRRVAFQLLGESEIDIDFDCGLIRRGDELPFVDGVFGCSGEHVVAADGLGGRDAAIGRYGGGDANYAADAHALGQLGIDRRDALLDSAVAVIVRRAKRQRHEDYECECDKSGCNPSRFLESVLKKMPFHSNHPGAKGRLVALSVGAEKRLGIFNEIFGRTRGRITVLSG